MSESTDQPGFVNRLFVRFLRSIIHTPAGIKTLSVTRFLYRPDPQDWVDINHIPIELPGLPQEFDGYRLVQISDFHLGTWLTREFLENATDLVNRQLPDLIAITGDFVTYGPERFVDDLCAGICRLSARDGIVAVMGNHDHWTDPDLIRKHLARIGVVELGNRVITIQRGDASLVVAGIDDVMAGKDDLSAILEAMPSGQTAILLAHEPDFADISSKTARFKLQLSGHTHGGQIILPWFGPLYLPKYGRKYPAGFHKVNNMFLYTNSGLGTAELQFRLNSRPEITIFTLKSVNSFT